MRNGCIMDSITRTFASGKTEKMVMQCLKDLGFASGKVSVVAVKLILHWCVYYFLVSLFGTVISLHSPQKHFLLL